ncbi:MAG: hypothetical protein VX246_16900 [Myxococcota bacterium]|nr:hypothetical protein [Myxococcota bacterium]
MFRRRVLKPMFRPLPTAIVLFATLIAATAFADEETRKPGSRYAGFDGTACEVEFKKLCPTSRSASSGYSCLRFSFDREMLTDGCAKHTEDLRRERQAKALARQKAWKDGCAEDIPKFCAKYAKSKPITIKGCLGKRRDELSEECNKRLPIRPGNQGPGRIRWRDGTEPRDWDLQNALKDRPRATQKRLDEIGREAWIKENEERRAAKIAKGNELRAAAKKAKDAEAAADGAVGTEDGETPDAATAPEAAPGPADGE